MIIEAQNSGSEFTAHIEQSLSANLGELVNAVNRLLTALRPTINRPWKYQLRQADGQRSRIEVFRMNAPFTYEASLAVPHRMVYQTVRRPLHED